MSRNNVKCPFCGTVNYNVDLEETGNWMECEKCLAAVNLKPFAGSVKIPLYTMEQLGKLYSTSKSQ